MDSNGTTWQRILGFSPALFAALTGITVTVIAYTLAVQWAEYRVYSRFERAALDHSATVQRGVSEAVNALSSLHDFYLASSSVEHNEFESFARGKLERLPGISAVFWAPRVTFEERTPVLAAARAFDPEFQIHNNSAVDDEADLYPVLYLQLRQGNEFQLGLNLASLPDIRPLLLHARDSGDMVSSPRISLKLADDTFDAYKVQLLKAVYLSNMPSWNTEHRRHNLKGFIALELTVADVVENALADFQEKGLDLEVTDLSAEKGRQLLYFHASRAKKSADREKDPVSNHTHLTFETSFNLGGRLWSIRETVVPDYFEWQQRAWEPTAVFGTGLLLTGMLVVYLLIVNERTERIQRIVRRRTADLRLSNDALSEEIGIRKAKESELENAKRKLEQQIRERTQSLTEHLERVIREMAEREKAEQRLQVEKEQAQVTLRSIADAVITTDAGGRINAMNPVAERLLGWSLSDARGRAIGDVYVIHDDANGKPMPNPVETALREHTTVQRGDDALFRSRDGKQFAFQNCAAPIRSPAGEIFGAILVFSDNSRYHRLARKLAYQAKHDSLTGIYNRRHFESCLEEALEDVEEGKTSIVLAYMDLDQFKVVNDTCGHLAGDELLRQVALILPQALRKEDVLARLGGDEFGLLLRDCSAQQARKIANELVEKIQTFRFVWETRTFRITLSIGLVTSSPARQTAAKMLSAADAACYLAKDHGRNRIHLFDDSDSDVVRRVSEMEWVSRIQEAVSKGNFRLSGQRIDSIFPDRANGQLMELLVSLKEDGDTVVPPASFIPAAERYNLMTDIDRWVVEQCLLRLDRLCLPELKDKVPDLLMINLSATSICNEQFLDDVSRLLGRSSMPAGKICFEITETAAVANLSNAIVFMRELKRLGCRFALDDFGSGMASFGYLKTLPVDYIKIDGAFIKDLSHDPLCTEIIQSIVRIAAVMRIKTIAECVEEPGTLGQLRALGVDYAQGYAIANPMPLDEWLTRSE